MPDRLYQPHNDPPTMTDRIAAHWAETVCAVLSVAVGVIVICGSLAPGFTPSAALDSIPDWQAWGIGLFMSGGGAVWAWSIVRYFKELTTLWAVQRIGSGLCGLGWTSYTMAAIAEHPERPVSWVASLALSGICWGCLGLSLDFERQARRITR